MARPYSQSALYSYTFAFVAIFLLLFPPLVIGVTRGPNLCDGTKWNLHYACDLSQSYAEPFLITDSRTADDPGAPSHYSYYENIDSYDIHTLDVFYPESCLTTKDCRVFINVHGGAWQEYYKEMIDDPEKQHASWYMSGKKGWIVVVPDYRLCDDKVFTAASCPSWPDDTGVCDSPQQAAIYPDNVNDISKIVDWVYKNAHLYGAKNAGNGNTYATDVWMMGHSAGGHLVMDWATNPEYETERSKVKGIIGLSGAYDITKLSPLLNDPINDTFRSGNGRTAEQWQQAASPTINLVENPAYPYPKLIIFDTGESDLFNLGHPSPNSPDIYPDIAQEFADRMRQLGYTVTEDPKSREADLWHIKLSAANYGHTDEYAATSYTGSDTDPLYFEGLYLPWVENPDCNEPTHILGPNNGVFTPGCRLFAKPPGNSWLQPTDIIVQLLENLSHKDSMLLLIVPVLAADKNK